MSKPEKQTVSCPKCGESISFTLWNSINTDMPNAIEDMISGKLFEVECGKCGYKTHVNYPMLFNDMKAEYDKGNYCVCGGDFNHDFTGDSTIVLGGGNISDFGWAQPFPASLLPEGIHQCLDYDDPELIPTCRNCDVPYGPDCQTFVLDGFVVSENVKPIELHNINAEFNFSDHNPVVMKFSLS